MAKKNTFKTNWPKWAVQWGVLAALVFFLSGLAAKIFTNMKPVDPEAYCPMGGLEAFTTYLVRGSLPCSMSSMQIIMGLALAAAVILFSKLFCSYICPIGTLEDLLSKGRKAIGLNGITIANGSILDKILRIFKYALLFWVVYMTVGASELFCKHMDPYYAIATGFKGEITLWMSIVTVALVVVFGFLIDRFWCRYICPLGAVSNTLKFWVWLLIPVALFWLLNVVGLKIAWWWLFGAFCLGGYLLEILSGKPKLQILHVVSDESKCGRSCYSCKKSCPYGIDVPSYGAFVTSVDCTLCGECVASCPTKALSIGVVPEKKNRMSKYLPALIAVAIMALAFIIGGKFELPTISETWGVEPGMKLETVKIEDLKSIKCFGSSMAFKARMEKVPGVHGVKTYVGSHSVVLSYDPKVISAEKVQSEVFVPSHFRVNSPDPAQVSKLKKVTIRTEHMSDKMDLNYLGLQMRVTGKNIYGLESEYDCPLIVHVYMDPAEQLDEEWFREVVSKKVLSMPVHGGGTKDTPVDFTFVRMEKGESFVPVKDYLKMMFDEFTAEFNGRYPSADTTIVKKRIEVYEGKPQYYFEIADQSYEKPIIRRVLPYLSNWLSSEEGVIGLYLTLNDDLVPCIRVRFADPMTSDKIWSMMTAEKWNITYSQDDVREMDAQMKFDQRGKVIPVR